MPQSQTKLTLLLPELKKDAVENNRDCLHRVADTACSPALFTSKGHALGGLLTELAA